MHTSLSRVNLHPWQCGDIGAIIAGDLRGLCGTIEYMFVGDRFQTVLGIRLQDGRLVEADAQDTIPV